MLRARKTLKTVAEFAEAGLIAPNEKDALAPVARRYALALTPVLADLIDPDDPGDPIARQFVPDARERHETAEERADPIGDAAHSPVPGIVHRYADRALLKITQVCPVYCRFCFRRDMVGPGTEAVLDAKTLERALSYLAAHSEIREVILTGGDPFVLAPRRIAAVTARLDAIAHVKILRWHTRVPVADPDAVTDTLVAALRRTKKAVYIVLHTNHPRELGTHAREAASRLIDAGIPMLSQSVLLKGVNDDIDTLEALMRALVEMRIKPYYLHHADLAPGTAHFRTTIADGQRLVRALHARCSGLAQPTYVLDIPGGYAKARLAEADLAGNAAALTLRDAAGTWHPYPPPGDKA